MDTGWLDEKQLDAWVKLLAVVELLPGVLDLPFVDHHSRHVEIDAVRMWQTSVSVQSAGSS